MMGIFTQLSILILVVLVVSFITRILKQPLIIGYLLSGILVGPFFLNILQENDTILTFSEFGIAFLLFIVGLSLSPKVIKEVGKISLVTGVGQVIFTSVIGYLIGILLGFSPLVSVYIAIALTFSSTIIIMKLLSDKEDLDKLYGKISIGFLLVQDFIAIIILIVISAFSSGLSVTNIVTGTLLKGVLLIIILIPISLYILPRLSSFFAKSQEFLFLFSIAWGLGFAALFFYAGFSIEVGALIAGIMLSMSPYSCEISSKMRPLRDFFIISFFLILGSQMVIGEMGRLLVPAIIFSIFILVGNPLIVVCLMGFLGYSKRTGFMAGLTVAQISEFSLILIALGVKIGHLSSEVLSFVTTVGIITIAGSTYMIIYSEKIYPYFSRFLSLFERKKLKEGAEKNQEHDYILLGYNRLGFSILKTLSKLGGKYLVVDFNPETIKKLSSKKINCLYGDVEDIEFLQELKIEKAKIIVSTVPENDANFLLIKKIREKNKNAIIITTASQIQETFKLYNTGADYVILPHFLGGNYTSDLINRARTKKKVYEHERDKQIKELKERLKEGQEHPKAEEK